MGTPVVWVRPLHKPCKKRRQSRPAHLPALSLQPAAESVHSLPPGLSTAWVLLCGGNNVSPRPPAGLPWCPFGAVIHSCASASFMQHTACHPQHNNALYMHTHTHVSHESIAQPSPWHSSLHPTRRPFTNSTLPPRRLRRPNPPPAQAGQQLPRLDPRRRNPTSNRRRRRPTPVIPHSHNPTSLPCRRPRMAGSHRF